MEAPPKAVVKDPTPGMIRVGVHTLRALLRDGIVSRDTPASHLGMICQQVYLAMVKTDVDT